MVSEPELPWLYGVAPASLPINVRSGSQTSGRSRERASGHSPAIAELQASRSNVRRCNGAARERDRELLLLTAWEGLTTAGGLTRPCDRLRSAARLPVCACTDSAGGCRRAAQAFPRRNFNLDDDSGGTVMTSDVLDRLARSNPVRGDFEPGDADLLEAILATPVDRLRRRPRARILLAGAAAACVAVLVAVALLPGERLGPSPAAARALERLAVAAAAQPAAPAGRWAYTRARTVYGGTNLDEPPYTVLLPSERETWVAPSGAARIVEKPGRPIFLNAADRRRWIEGGGRQWSREPTDRRYRSLPLPLALYKNVSELPTEPGALEDVLRHDVETQNPPPEEGYSEDGELRDRISSLLHSRASSGDLRAALYRILAGLPDVELVGDVRDPVGRTGVGLESPGGYGDEGNPTSRRLIVDPETGNVLAELTVLERRVEWIDAAPGDVIGEIVYLEHGWVGSSEERP